jgi:DUF2909 family protein
MPAVIFSQIRDGCGHAATGCKQCILRSRVAALFMRILVILFLIFIVGSLLSALYFLVVDRGRSDRMAKALTVRVVLSVVLFALLMLGYYLGMITGKIH